MILWNIKLELVSKWIIEYTKAKNISPCKKFVLLMKETFGDKVTVTHEKLDHCELSLETEADIQLMNLELLIHNQMKDKMEITNEELGTFVFVSINLSDTPDKLPGDKPGTIPDKMFKETDDNLPQQVEEKVVLDAFDRTSMQKNNNMSPVQVEETMDRINNLIGANEFKNYANELLKVAPRLKEHKLEEMLHRKCILFSVDQGYGFSTYAELLAELMVGLSLFEFSKKDKVVEITVTAEDVKNPEGVTMERILTHLENDYYKNKLLCLDCRNWLDATDSITFKNFLKKLLDYSNNYILVIKIPFIEKGIVKNIQRSLQDVWSVQVISVEPYDNDELNEYAARLFHQYQAELDEEVWDIFTTRVIEEKSDGRFYGFVTIEKIVNEFIYKALINASDTEKIRIKKYDVMDLVDLTFHVNKSGYDMLEELIGLDHVKSQIRQIIAQILFVDKFNNENQDKEIKKPVLHMQFLGNPGTGKTTVARIVGKILKESGLLRKGNLYEYKGRDLCGKYVGHTAPKTMEICRDAYGSVLFIDEAYTLNDGDLHHSYGKEAIETLAVEMENHSSDLLVIFAGYKDEMEDLMKINPGLASRIPYCIEFPSYNREQLYEIFIKIISRNFNYTEDFAKAAKEYFGSLQEEILEAKDFSNARFVRNFSERIWAKAALRIQLNKLENCLLLEEDLKSAILDEDFTKINQKKSRMGFSM